MLRNAFKAQSLDFSNSGECRTYELHPESFPLLPMRDVAQLFLLGEPKRDVLIKNIVH